jgi:hypothetical protein
LQLFFYPIIIFNNIHKYTYSIFGIEFPEIRYKQIPNYNIKKNIRIKQKGYTLYVTDLDNENYYLFDLTHTLNYKRLPYVDTALNNLIFVQLFSFFLNLILVKIISN